MRVALVARTVGRGAGTAGYTHHLATTLSGRGHEVEVWSAESHVREAVPYRTRVLPGPALGGLGGVCLRAWFSRSIGQEGYDIVQGFGRTLGHDVFRASGGAHAAWLERKPVRQRSLREWVELKIDERACREARHVICPSHRVAADLVAYYGLATRRLTVVRNGVDGSTFRPDPERRANLRAGWGLEGEAKAVLFFGHGFARKGLATAVEAFERGATRRDRFLVMGDDSKANLYRRALTDRLGSQLIWLGSEAHPERYVVGADAAILPTRYDAGANTTLEALACGVPVVTSDMDGSGEVAPDRALVVAAGAGTRSWGCALTFALQGGASLRRACREASCSWTVERNGQETEAVYREVLGG